MNTSTVSIQLASFRVSTSVSPDALQPMALKQYQREISSFARRSFSTHDQFEVRTYYLLKLLTVIAKLTWRLVNPDAVQYEISHPLVLISQKSFDTGTQPSEWRTSMVTPKYKGWAKLKPNGYWSESITCICCKLLGSKIKNELKQSTLRKGATCRKSSTDFHMAARTLATFTMQAKAVQEPLSILNSWTLSNAIWKNDFDNFNVFEVTVFYLLTEHHIKSAFQKCNWANEMQISLEDSISECT